MTKLLEEIKVDARFIRSHTLQPQWFKVFKVFLLVGVIAGYAYFSGVTRTAVFVALFVFLMLLVHLLYRYKTDTWKQSWLDFVVVEESGEARPTSIGKFYYAAVIFNAVASAICSQSVP